VTAPGNSRGATVAFEKARADGRAALVGYLPAGYPTVDGSAELLTAMIDAGCDLVEVGLPFSDPVLDGPSVQHAAGQALQFLFRLAPQIGFAPRAVRQQLRPLMQRRGYGTAALDATLAQVLAGIARCSPNANAVTKRLLLASRTMAREELLEQSADAFAACLRSEEGREGVTAFLEKRKARWAE